MKTRNKRISKQLVLLCFAFVVLFLSYAVNLWKITDDEYLHGFEKAPEGLVVGRLIKAEKDGIFSDGGFTGIVYNADSSRNENEVINEARLNQHDIYLTNKPAPDSFWRYSSQIGGQAILYSFIQKISPFSHRADIQIFRFINSALTALCFILFLGWCYRNYGFFSSFVTFVLLLFSPWINNFAHNLWWSLWSFYLPFLCMFLIMERNASRESQKKIKIYLPLFFAVLVKCIFSGYEYITATLLAIICPFVYYSFLEGKSFKTFIVNSLKAGVTAIAAVLTSMLILVFQMRMATGSFADGITYILHAYSKRTTFDSIENSSYSSVLDVVKEYLGGNAYSLGYFTEQTSAFPFWALLLIIIFCTYTFCIINQKVIKQKKSTALVLTTWFSLLCPLSWFIIFKQHAVEHPHLDYIVWYMPYIIFGFLIIGQTFVSVKKIISIRFKHK